VICYLNAGAWEDWRPDSQDFPEATLGKDYQGWPGERWLDIRQIEQLESLMDARLDLCAQKGFDGVEPDNMDGYTNNTGFPLSYNDQIEYNRWVANQAHARNLAVGLKNDPEQVLDLVDYFDWMTTESCFDENWCDKTLPFLQAGKPVIAIEYTGRWLNYSDICRQPLAKSIHLIFKHRQLDAWMQVCP
jgi:hypothetical protein